MNELLQHVQENIRQRQLFCPGQSLLVAVSGGLDSMVLLRALHELSAAQGWRLTVGHLNHQLRGRSSDADERLVRQTAGALGCSVIVERAAVREFGRARKMSLEMAARKLRHAFLARAARNAGAGHIVLAHHAEDQLELFFLRLLRGGGSEGLSGMKWKSPSPEDSDLQLVRPLLDFPKESLRQWAAAEKVPFREDATNLCLDIQRNRIRHELLPLLRQHYQPGLDKTILRTMDILGAEAEFVTEAAKKRGTRGGFKAFPVAVQRRALRLQLLNLGIEADYDLVEQLRLAPGRPVALGQVRSPKVLADGHQVQNPQAGPLYAVRNSAGRVELRRKTIPAFQTESLELDLGGPAGKAVFAGATINWQRVDGGLRPRLSRQAGREVFDADQVGRRVVLRHWQPGDRFQPIGLAEAVKLQDFFVNQKILRDRRHELMVAVSAFGEVFWVEGLRISERFKLTKQTKHRLHWRWQRR